MKNFIAIFFMLLVGAKANYAQQATLSAGGEASGNGGSFSYSIGQTVYTTEIGTNGTVLQGVQQPVDVPTDIVGLSHTINLSVYPNPTANYLILKIENALTLKTTYELLDIQGKVLKNGRVSTASTSIELKTIPNSTYFLKVAKDGQWIKTFRIIKN